MATCSNCGTGIEVDDRFCGSCGTPVEPAATQPQGSPPPPAPPTPATAGGNSGLSGGAIGFIAAAVAAVVVVVLIVTRSGDDGNLAATTSTTEGETTTTTEEVTTTTAGTTTTAAPTTTAAATTTAAPTTTLGGDLPLPPGPAYSGFETITDNSGTLEMSVPVEWIDRGGLGWAPDGGDIVGASLRASTDWVGFQERWDTPGVFFGVQGGGGQHDASTGP